MAEAPWPSRERRGDHTRTIHDGIQAAIAAALRATRIKFLGGGQTTSSCKGIFKRLMHAIDEDPTAGEATKRPLCGISADFMVDLASADGSDTMDGALCSTVLDLARTLLDVKIFASGDLYRQFSALEGILRPMEARTRRKDHAFEMHKQSIVRLWGLTAQRGWAHLILDRLGALVHGSAATIHGNVAGHVDDAAEH